MDPVLSTGRITVSSLMMADWSSQTGPQSISFSTMMTPETFWCFIRQVNSWCLCNFIYLVYVSNTVKKSRATRQRWQNLLQFFPLMNTRVRNFNSLEHQYVTIGSNLLHTCHAPQIWWIWIITNLPSHINLHVYLIEISNECFLFYHTAAVHIGCVQEYWRRQIFWLCPSKCLKYLGMLCLGEFAIAVPKTIG